MSLYYDTGLAPSGPPPPTTYSAYPSPFAFDLSTILGGVAMGRDMSANFAVSLMGVAVMRPNGTWVTLAHGLDALVDVTPLLLPGVDPLVMRVPVPLGRLVRGNLIIVTDTPFTPLFVLDRPGDDRRVSVLNPLLGEIGTFAPPRNLFIDFVIRAVTLFDTFGNGGGGGGRRRRHRRGGDDEPPTPPTPPTTDTEETGPASPRASTRTARRPTRRSGSDEDIRSEAL